MNAPSILLVLIAATLLFGIGVVVVGRRRAGSKHGEFSGTSRPSRETVSRGSTLRERLDKTASAFGGLAGIRQKAAIGRETWDEVEATLLRADVGIGVTRSVIDELRRSVDDKRIRTGAELIEELRAALTRRLQKGSRDLEVASPPGGRINVWLLVGVNGVGKTTTAGKLAARQVEAGRRVLLAAGDTFRAAAAEQLEMWATRTGADVVRGSEGGDPSSVVFDAIQRAGSRGYDLVIADTAGRLHTKSNLMEELRKVRRIADREPGMVSEVLLVIDATTGQNGLAQAREFAEAAGVTGVVLTKLDGSAKGGIIFAIESELGIPVKCAGIGETVSDLVPFDTSEFVSALFDL